MAWGLFKKIKNALQTAGKWVKNKVIKPAYEKVVKPAYEKVIKPVIGTVVDMAPVIGGAVATGITKNPQAGMMIGGSIGSAVQNVGNNLGFGSGNQSNVYDET